VLVIYHGIGLDIPLNKVVEDNEVNIRIIVRLLRKYGYEVPIAKNGVEVLDMVKEAEAAGQSFDGILMDVQV